MSDVRPHLPGGMLHDLKIIAYSGNCINISCNFCPLRGFCNGIFTIKINNHQDASRNPSEVIQIEAQRRLDLIAAEKEIKELLE